MSKLVLALDSWQIKAFSTCPQEFKLRFKENLRRSQYFLDSKRYADRGTIAHVLLSNYYTLRALDPKEDRFKHGSSVITLARKNGLIRKAGFDEAFEKLLIERFQQYLFKYSPVGCDFIPLHRSGIVGVEVPFSVKIFENEKVVFLLDGRLDLVSRYSVLPTPCFVDHKTQEKVSNLYDWKTQFLCYAIATGYEYGVINYFGLQKDYKEGISLRQKLIHIPKEFREYYKNYLVREIYFPLANALQFNDFRHNWNSCSGAHDKYPCDFTPICQQILHPERQALIKSQYYTVIPPWSPWTDAKAEEALENEETI